METGKPRLGLISAVDAAFSSRFLPCLHWSPRKPSPGSPSSSFAALVRAEQEEFIVLWKLRCHGNSGTWNFNCKAQYMFMKIINKNANRDDLIVLVVSFVPCFSLSLFRAEFSGTAFLKITNFTICILKFGFSGFFCCCCCLLNQMR